MISLDEVRKIARLSKLEITDEEAQHYAGELSKILGFADKLEELDLSQIKATSHAVDLVNVFRKDKAILSDVVGAVLAQAPDGEETFFSVPKVI
jgi:aspartyl-tRNA(Asn)/glutamyl-tRNA(Gln) amidotransferase subunit C